MKLISTILISLITFNVLSGSGESAMLKKLDEYMHSDHSAVESLIKKIESQAVDYSDDGKLHFLLYKLAHLSTSQGDNDNSFDEVLNKIKVSSADKQLLLSLKALFNRNGSESMSSDPVEVIEDVKFSDPVRNSIQKSIVLYYRKMFDPGNHFSVALKHAKRASIPILPSIIFQVVSRKYMEQGEYKKVVEIYQKAIDHAESKDQNFCVLQNAISMAFVQLEMDNLDKAQKFFSRALGLSNKLNNDWFRSKCFRGLGEINIRTNNIFKGIRNFQRALTIYYRLSSDLGIAQTHMDLGFAYFKSKEYDLAESNYQLSKTYYDKLDKNNEGKDELYEKLALLAYEEGNYQEALRYINHAIDLRKTISDGELVLYETYEIRSRIYAALGKGKKAYEDLLSSTSFKDSLYSANLQEQIAELSELYESEQKSKQIYEQEQRLKEERNERLLREQQLENVKLRNRQIILIFIFALLIILAVSLIIYFRIKQNRLKREQTETELRQQLLRSQMNPHFVFNAMSVIQSYIYDNNTEKSSEFLVSLSRLMRLILENSSKESIKLNTELEILDRYLFIQQERFESRFRYEILEDPNVDKDHVLIPPMILQPFVENATEHGELDKVRNGKIRISYSKGDRLLIFVVEDNGIGRKAARAKEAKRKIADHKSMAIEITEKRIELMRMKYNIQGYVKIEDLNVEENSGTRVTVAIPIID
tara:strand:+ start:173146 stop:175260 length:2115 start_codon:yes stop_codon:yes gene_type:complete